MLDGSDWNTVQLARNYFNNEGLANALKYYTDAFTLNPESDLADTLILLRGMIRYDSALNSATELKNAATANYDLTAVTDIK